VGTVTFRVGPCRGVAWRACAWRYHTSSDTPPRREEQGLGTRTNPATPPPPRAPRPPPPPRLLRCPVLQSPPLLAPPVSSLSPPSRPPPAQAPGGSLPSLRRRRRPVGEVSSAPRARSSLCRPQSVCSVPQPSSRSGLSAPLPPPPNALLA
jgi:hypothetical protein